MDDGIIITKGATNLTPLYFFSETIITITVEFTYIVGTSRTKLVLFSHKVSTIHTISLPPPDTLYAGRVKLFAVSTRRSPQNVLGVHPSRSRKGGRMRVLNQDCREDEGEQSTP